ncbi:MAG TPA: hypothetical protein VHK27_08385 [Gammaproteobacteria bacterium]|nr:hypothetical protein [Gammaproteobacteria bacterium]
MTIPIRFLLSIRLDLGRTSVRAGLLVCLPVFALLAAGPVHAATLTVCPSGCDFSAIQPAVDSALSDDTIRIYSGVYPGSVSITDKSLVLQGDGPTRTVIREDPLSGSPIVILSCSQSFPITIQDLAITNTHSGIPRAPGLDNSGCELKLKNSSVTGNGVGISHSGSTLSIENSVVANNEQGISVASGTGTLIHSAVTNNSGRFGLGIGIGTSGALRVKFSTISNNGGSFGPGGIENSGELVVSRSTITNNTTTSMGGGIMNKGIATLNNSMIVNNVAEAGDGGGIFNFGMLTLTRSTVHSNKAICEVDQPICEPPPHGGRGGGIFNAGSATLIGSLIMSNFATYDGGGAFNEGGTMSQTDGTLIMNNTPDDCVGC